VSLRQLAEGQSCVRCGSDNGVVGAHYTGVRREAYGGGFGRKVHDLCICHLCASCHRDVDTLSRDKAKKWEHSEEMQHSILLTLIRLYEQGHLVLK